MRAEAEETLSAAPPLPHLPFPSPSLIAESQTTLLPESFDAAVLQGSSVCVYKGTAMADFVTDNYAGADVVLSEGDPFLDHAAGSCDVVVSTKQPEFDFAVVGGADTNPGCTLSPIGGANFALKKFGGGWMVRSDYADKCTSLINDVFLYWLIDMQLDKTINNVYETLTKAKTKKMCASTSESDEDEGEGDELTGLSPYQLCGVWLLHGSICLAVAVFTAVARLRPKREAAAAPIEDTRSCTRQDILSMKYELLRHLNTLERDSSRAQSRELFRRMSEAALDGEDDGGLSHDQVLVELQALNPSITKEQATALIRRVDKDDDGSIEIDEFLELMRLAENDGVLPRDSASGSAEKLRRQSVHKDMEHKEIEQLTSLGQFIENSNCDYSDEALDNAPPTPGHGFKNWLCAPTEPPTR